MKKETVDFVFGLNRKQLEDEIEEQEWAGVEDIDQVYERNTYYFMTKRLEDLKRRKRR